MTITDIKMEDVGRASQNNDLDAALKPLMDIAGITTGDVAAQVFSGFDWQSADQWARVQQLARWIQAEQNYARASGN